jgi:DNA-binding LacI/PurR family transcriptional regulator
MAKDNHLLYIQIKEQLIEEIKFLQPNDRLLARTELVKKYQVTRTTIDRAISELIGEGYLYSRDGSGTYVFANEARPIMPDNTYNVVGWGVIVPDISCDIYPSILRGVEDVADQHNINVVICNSDNLSEKQTNYVNKLIDADVKGLIIVPALKGKADLLSFQRLQEKNIPFIFCNRSVVGVEAPKVVPNSFYGGYLATRHLIECGYRRIAFVSRPVYSITMERYQGYLSALLDAGLELNEDYVFFDESFDARTGYENTKRLLTQSPRPDAVFANDDLTAQGAYDAIVEVGLEVGLDIGLVGYDDSHLCERLSVKLTSVKFCSYEIGFKAAELLWEIRQGHDIPINKTVVFHPELVIRESSKAKIC